VETVQIGSFCVLTPILLQVDTDVSEKYSVSIFRDERIGPSWCCSDKGGDVVGLHRRVQM